MANFYTFLLLFAAIPAAGTFLLAQGFGERGRVRNHQSRERSANRAIGVEDILLG
jgi:hypothetical protein